MTAPLQVALALGSVGVLLGLMAGLRRYAGQAGLGPELQRKLVHMATGLYALGLPWLFPDRWPVYMIVALTLGVLLILRMPGSRLGETLHGVERHSYGDLLLAVSVALCLFLAGDDLYLYVLPIAVLTLADAAAALAGTTYGTRFFTIEEGRKSVEGSAVFFLLTLVIAMMCLMLMTPLPPANIIVISLMVAGFGTLVEATSWRGFDNLFLPLGLLIFLLVHAGSTLAELIWLALVFACSIFAFRTLAPRLGLSKHAGHVYVISVFMLVAGASVQNALIPILVLAAHAWCRTTAPCAARYPDLDVVAALALVSFGWLALGNAMGPNAVTFYGLTAMGMVMGLSAIAVSADPWPRRALLLACVAAALCALHAFAIAANPPGVAWNGAMWPVALACLALAAVVPLAAPGAYMTARVARVTLAALIVPFGTYLVSYGPIQ